MCWSNAQGVQHLTCVRSIPSDHSAAKRQPKQSNLVICDGRLASGGEQREVGSRKQWNRKESAADRRITNLSVHRL